MQADPHAASVSRLPAFVHRLRLQTPPEGAFDSSAVQWQVIRDGKHWAHAAAFPEARLDDFLKGEAARGGCRLRQASHGCTGSLTRNDRVACCYAADRHAVRVQRQQLLPSEAPALTADGKAGRKNANQRGTGFAKGCIYCCFVKSYKKLPGIVIVKFACPGPEAQIAAEAASALSAKSIVPAIFAGDMCPSMGHTLVNGAPAHVGERLHQQEHTPDAVKLVLAKLRGRMKTGMIKAGANLCLACGQSG